MSYQTINNVIYNKIDKATYDLYVSTGSITPEMIANQAWFFTDDQFFSAEEKAKLASLVAGGEANVIEGVSVNGVVQTPAEGTKVVNIVVPTKTSELINDYGFITNAVNDLVNYYTKSEAYSKAEINALISNINSLNVLVVTSLPTENISNTTLYLVPKTTEGTQNIYDEYLRVNNAWEKIGDTEINLSNYALKTEVPTKLSQLINDANYLTSETDPTVPAWAKAAEKPTYTYSEIADKPNLANVATSGSYNDLTDKPEQSSAVIRIWSQDEGTN